jgi:hypothetical protein
VSAPDDAFLAQYLFATLWARRLPKPSPEGQAPDPDADDERDDYCRGYCDGVDNKGCWGGESAEWIRGFNDGTENRIQGEIDGA